jgi:chromosomal replication initiator protein
LWGQALDDLSLQMTRDTFNTWLKPTRCLELVNDTLTIAVDDHYRQEWLENRLRSTIQRTVDALANRQLSIEFVVHPPAAQGPTPDHWSEP